MMGFFFLLENKGSLGCYQNITIYFMKDELEPLLTKALLVLTCCVVDVVLDLFLFSFFFIIKSVYLFPYKSYRAFLILSGKENVVF